MITDLSNTYIKVSSPEEAERVQNKAFELGWSWDRIGKDKKPSMLDRSGFAFSKDKWICWIGKVGAPSGRAIGFKQITLEDLFGKETEPSSEFKKGDVVVVTKRYNSNYSEVGMIVTYNYAATKGDHCVTIPALSSSTCSGVRHATAAEKQYHAIHGNGCIMAATKASPAIRVSAELDAIVDGLIDGEVYNTGLYLFRLWVTVPISGSTHYWNIHYKSMIKISTKELKTNSNWNNHKELAKLSPATNDQIIWLEECEQKGEYMSRSAALERRARIMQAKISIGPAGQRVETYNPLESTNIIEHHAGYRFGINERVITPQGEGVVVGISKDHVQYLVKILGLSDGHNGNRVSLIAGNTSTLNRNGKWFMEESLIKAYLSPALAPNGGRPELVFLNEEMPPINTENLQKAFNQAYPKTLSDAFEPTKYVDGTDMSLPPKQQDPTNLKPPSKKRKPMSVKPTSKFSNLVTPKSNKK